MIRFGGEGGIIRRKSKRKKRKKRRAKEINNTKGDELKDGSVKFRNMVEIRKY